MVQIIHNSIWYLICSFFENKYFIYFKILSEMRIAYVSTWYVFFCCVCVLFPSLEENNVNNKVYLEELDNRL